LDNPYFAIQVNGSVAYPPIVVPVIENNTIHSNYGGIQLYYFAAPMIINNTIIWNTKGIYSIAFGFAGLYGNTIKYNTDDGVNLELGHFEIHDNIIASNGGYGIVGDHASVNATRNKIYDNHLWGIRVYKAPLLRDDNHFGQYGSYNKAGDMVQVWELDIKVLDSNNRPVNNVELEIYNKTGELVWSNTTIGHIRTAYLREFESANNATPRVHNPFEIRASKEGIRSSKVVNVSENLDITIFMDTGQEVSKDYEYPLWGIALVSGIWIAVAIIVLLGGIVVLIRRRRI
jgi:parallel beta-helix repeat protein